MSKEILTREEYEARCDPEGYAAEPNAIDTIERQSATIEALAEALRLSVRANSDTANGLPKPSRVRELNTKLLELRRKGWLDD